MRALSRRNFTKALGGLVLAFTLEAAAQPRALPGSLGGNRRLDAWIRIAPDGNATVFTGKVELGQGILTALRQIAAEELDLPVARVTILSGDTGRTPNEGMTAGSQSVENSGTALRLAAAEVRGILVELASTQLGMSADSLSVADGVISAANGKRVSYAELAASLDLKREATVTVRPKPAGLHAIVGRPVARLDIPGKVTGAPMYVQDLRLPGMVHGRVVRPPHYGATLDAVDDAKVRAMAGVLAVVRDGSFLGVIAQREEQAVLARAALAGAAKWKPGAQLPDPARLFEHLKSLPTKVETIGVKQATAPAAVKTLEARYSKPYTAHASIGPSAAVAQFDGACTVWTHSQGVFPLRAELARALKIEPAAIRCIHVEGSGCYGHNGADDVALDAALLARAWPGVPVRLQWMRDDEFAWEPYGPAMAMQARGALDAAGRIVDWNYELWSNTHSTRPLSTSGANVLAAWHVAAAQRMGPPTSPPQPAGGGDRNAIPLYDFPNQKVVHHFIQEMPIRVSALRGLGAYANVFAAESFMDELALAAGADPVAFRLAHLKDPRAKAVIEKVAALAGWQDGAKGGDGRGRGIGFARYKNLACYCAVVAEMEVDRPSGAVRVTRAYAAVDAGLIINPDGIVNQIEGGIIQSASWTLLEQVKFAPDGIVTRDWSGYPILSIAQAPKVEVALINRPEERALGAGEGSQGPAAAAIANAFAHATGRRVRDLPFDPERVKAVLG
jgi:CO/xanthine dehydrogenase Mo-binding subunit